MKKLSTDDLFKVQKLLKTWVEILNDKIESELLTATDVGATENLSVNDQALFIWLATTISVNLKFAEIIQGDDLIARIFMAKLLESPDKYFQTDLTNLTN